VKKTQKPEFENRQGSVCGEIKEMNGSFIIGRRRLRRIQLTFKKRKKIKI